MNLDCSVLQECQAATRLIERHCRDECIAVQQSPVLRVPNTRHSIEVARCDEPRPFADDNVVLVRNGESCHQLRRGEIDDYQLAIILADGQIACIGAERDGASGRWSAVECQLDGTRPVPHLNRVSVATSGNSVSSCGPGNVLCSSWFR